MKRIHIAVFITACITFSFLLFGCGSSSGPGAPGSCGAEDTGMQVTVPVINHSSPAIVEAETWFIDLYQDLCEQDYEPWGDDYAFIVLVSSPIYDPDLQNLLFVTNYRVTFDPLSPDYPPIDEIRAGIQGYTITDITTTFPFMIFDFGRTLPGCFAT